MEVGNRGKEKERKDLHVTAITQRFDNVMATTPSFLPRPLSRPRLRRTTSRRSRQGPHSVTDTLTSVNDTRPNIVLSFFSNLSSFYHCKGTVGWGVAPPGAAGQLAQRGHVPLGL
jgi:hypothetical protein